MVLSIDGGGMRGVIPARIMQRLDVDAPGWRDGVVLRAGTSTGGLLALGLAAGMTPGEMVEVYHVDGATIFRRGIIDKIADVFGVAGAMYDLDGLEQVLDRLFGRRLLGDLAPVMVTAFDLDGVTPQGRQWKPKVFHNVGGLGTDDRSVTAAKAGLYTSAAPVYFPDADGFIDGGVWAGNPALAALALALDHRKEPRPSIETIRVMSLGTGRTPERIVGENVGRGIIDYGVDLVRMPIAASADAVHYICEQVLGLSGTRPYVRSQPTLPTAWEMDDHEAVPRMSRFADTIDLRPLLDWLQT